MFLPQVHVNDMSSSAGISIDYEGACQGVG
ncbi:hypothetical protein Mal48_08050 [Thalassoglobus polymorphus]|uniref:Uncharacterized protein n=1 Tax=Thalassoglobus polymorphus TaxID=2527994 RepID=A0A517QIU4_9PLAN|nr:hypothetical protein Mal48_08050 [Thalassoglobus polymorphus]